MKEWAVGLAFVVLFVPLVSQDRPEVVHEKVTVSWWIVPLVVVDGAGNPVTELNPQDLTIRVDGQAIESFLLFRDAAAAMPQAAPAEAPAPPVQVPSQAAPPKRRLILFLFDTAVSTGKTIRNSCRAAGEILRLNHDENARFAVLLIDGQRGLSIHCSPTGDKNTVQRAVDKIGECLAPVQTFRSLDPLTDLGIMEDMGGRTAKFDAQDLRLICKVGSKYEKKSNRVFFESFSMLYYLMNAVDDIKFAYLFSDGVNPTVFDSTAGELHDFLQETARYLNRSGVMLTIIQPSSAVKTVINADSEDATLSSLAEMSGGRLVQGDPRRVAAEVDRMNRGCFQAAFPFPQDGVPRDHNLQIVARHAGWHVNTLRVVAARHGVQDMNETEREMLVQNLVFHRLILPNGLRAFKVKKETVREAGREHLRFEMPAFLVGRQLEVYRVVLDKNREVTAVQHETVTCRGSWLDLAVPRADGGRVCHVILAVRENIVLVETV